MYNNFTAMDYEKVRKGRNDRNKTGIEEDGSKEMHFQHLI